MYIAAEKGNACIIRLLAQNPYFKDKCVDINEPTTTELHRGNALHVAVMFDKAFTVSALLQMGADWLVAYFLGMFLILLSYMSI